MRSRASIATIALTLLATPALGAPAGAPYDPAPPVAAPVAPAPVPAPAAPAAPAPLAPTTSEPGPKWKAEMADLRAQVTSLRRQLAEQRRASRKEMDLLRRSRVAREQDLLRALSKEPTVIHALELGAAAFGVPPERLRRIAWCESNHVPTAQLGPYLGLFQFGPWLWGHSPFGKFERTDPYAAALAASWAFSRGYDKHWPVCGKL